MQLVVSGLYEACKVIAGIVPSDSFPHPVHLILTLLIFIVS